MPHGHCYLWEPALVGIHVVSDLLIGFAYLSISILLYLLIRKIKMPFSPIVLAFGVFIGACGLTHFVEVWNLWNADYWFGGWVKVITAAASVLTGFALFRLSPKIVAFAAAAKLSDERGIKLEAAYADMEKRVQERTKDLEAAKDRERDARKQVEALYSAAQKVNRLKDEFLATMSHELRTPLSVILGYSDMLVNDDLDEEAAKQAAVIVKRNAQTQAQLVNDLLDVSMIISGKMQLESRVFDIQEPIRAAIESVSLAAKSKEIHVIVQDSEIPLLVLGDSMRIQQIVWNLLSNSIKFTNKGGTVKIEVAQENSKCKIQVTDSGIGIDAQFLPHVFERFSQEDASSSRKAGGLGLGLGIVRHLTELHGGSVAATSDGKGKGATFIIYLRLAPFKIDQNQSSSEVSDKVSPVISAQEKMKAFRILVVDDDEDIRGLVRTSLLKQGFQVESAENAVQALSLMMTFQPHILVCDIGMPDTDGYSLIRMIRDQEMKHGGFVPAIALTAYAHEGVKQKVLASGFQSYLTKPTQPDLLLQEIRVHLML